MRTWYDRLPIGRKREVWAYLFLALPLVFYVVIRFYPTFDSFRISLTDWNLVRQPNFVGLRTTGGSSPIRSSGR